MTLLTHLLWGMLFAKIAGFSFFILRLSTMIMSLIGIWVLYELIFKISKSVRAAFLAALVVMFNPIYFNLSNTYMTDITFIALLILCCYFVYLFFERNTLLSFSLVFVFSILLVLTRQLGIVLPISFLLSCLALKERRNFYLVIGILLTAINFIILRYYENYLHQILPASATYKFSGEINPLNIEFWKALIINLRWRYSTILMHLLVFTLPFSIVYLVSFLKAVTVKIRLLVSFIVLASTLYVFSGVPFPMGNVFVNIGVGTRTFYEYLCSTTANVIEHASSQVYEDSMHWIMMTVISINLVIIVLGVIKWRRSEFKLLGGNPSKVFFLLFIVSYTIMILIPGSYFDRYHLPIITVGIILLSYLNKLTVPNFKLALPLVLLIMYVSVAGTKDYFLINRIRWQAYEDLKSQKVSPEKINGGFEVNCWNEGRYCFWYTFLDLKGFDYLIQFSPEPEFKPVREYEFQRYFPYKKDKIFIFARSANPG